MLTPDPVGRIIRFLNVLNVEATLVKEDERIEIVIC